MPATKRMNAVFSQGSCLHLQRGLHNEQHVSGMEQRRDATKGRFEPTKSAECDRGVSDECTACLI